jgi:8-oxo-dGTP pyrophosphatase MutT (NUDIX family)
MPPCGLDVAAATKGQPFCAGVVLMLDNRLVLTLNRDHLPSELDGSALRVGGVGGGQEAGETIWECAAREAVEEIGSEVTLIRSPRTYIRELPDGVPRQARCRDAIAPLLFEWAERPDPSPYAPGLPSGPRLYGAIFLARPASQDFGPVDVEGLLLMSPSDWGLVDQRVTLREAAKAGVSLIERGPIQTETRLWSFPEESMRAVCELVACDPELLAPLS